MKNKIYVVGHKNPDTDSIASAYALASLRQRTNPESEYISARAGNANNQTKYIFERAGLQLPQIIKDVYPKVEDIMEHNTEVVSVNAPVMDVFTKIQETGAQQLPVVTSDGSLAGLVGSAELMHIFIQDEVTKRPRYFFKASYIPDMIKGSIYHKGELEEFRAAVMVGAMRVEQSLERIEKAGAEETILVVGNRREVIECAIAQKIPAIIITGTLPGEIIEIDLKNYCGWIFLSNLDSAETIRRMIMACPVEKIMEQKIEALSPEDYVDEAQNISYKSRQRVFPVTNEGKLVGVVTRNLILQKFKSKLILVDHNEAAQAVDGIETAEVLEIVDHHRLGAVKTNAPVNFYAKPVGSTCTLVWQLFAASGIEPDQKVAMLMMGGIISDTVMLKSPTTTTEDKTALRALEKLTGLSAEAYGLDIFSATDSLSARTPESIITTDFKMYSEFGISFGVGQVEVVTLSDVNDMYERISRELTHQKQVGSLDWALLLITDIIKEESVLICTQFDAAEKQLNYRKISEHYFSLPGVLSRKKQLLPELLRIVEELA